MRNNSILLYTRLWGIWWYFPIKTYPLNNQSCTKGCIDSETKVVAYVLGSKIAPGENNDRRSEGIIIKPLIYNVVMTRAKSRLLKLYDKVKNSAPFLEDKPLQPELQLNK